MTYDNTPDNGKVIIHETFRNLDAKKDCWTAAAFDLQVYISKLKGCKSNQSLKQQTNRTFLPSQLFHLGE